MVHYICGQRNCVTGSGETAPTDREPEPSVAYVTFDSRKFHEILVRGTDTHLRITDKLHVGGSVFTDGGRFGLQVLLRDTAFTGKEETRPSKTQWTKSFIVICTFLKTNFIWKS